MQMSSSSSGGALEQNMRPENLYYPCHHMEVGCATKIRDLLDRKLGGLLR